MIENPAGLDYDFGKVLITPEQSGYPLRQRGFFMPARKAPPAMGRVRLSERLAARLCSSFHTLPAPLKTGHRSLEQRSIPA